MINEFFALFKSNRLFVWTDGCIFLIEGIEWFFDFLYGLVMHGLDGGQEDKDEEVGHSNVGHGLNSLRLDFSVKILVLTELEGWQNCE